MPIDEKPSRNEEEYFRKLDAELIQAQREKLDAERAELERTQRDAERAQWYMRCPKCGEELEERDVDHVKVDVCPAGHGTWLDAGELELLRQTERQGISRIFDVLGRKKQRE
jgi:Zn-finger nucleic acid-binding protein